MPGCGRRATSTVKPVAITVNGRPMTVERLCGECRKLIGRQSSAARVRRRPPVEGRWRCHGCDREWTSYRAAEACADTHHGARITQLPGEQ